MLRHASGAPQRPYVPGHELYGQGGGRHGRGAGAAGGGTPGGGGCSGGSACAGGAPRGGEPSRPEVALEKVPGRRRGADAPDARSSSC